MRWTVFLALVVAAVSATAPARASGVNFSWDACTSEGGVQSKTFACNTNTGSSSGWASFVLASDQSAFVGIEAVIDIQTQADSLPSWWQVYGGGTCRQNALTASIDFTSAPDSLCHDFWGGGGTGGITAYQTYWTDPQVPSGSPSTARIKYAAAVPYDSPLSLTGGTEYYAFRVQLSNAKTVGTGACSGCDVPACLTLSEIKVYQQDGSFEDLTSAITANIILWQTSTPCGGMSAPQRITWGQIKSVLR